MRLAPGDALDEALRRCLTAYPEPPRARVDVTLPGFWTRAVQHGVAVLVARQLEIQATAQPIHRAQAAVSIRVLSVLRSVLGALADAGVPAMPLKGPTLAARLYGDYTLRPTSDVDVLVSERGYPRALATLQKLGAQLEPEYAENQAFFERHHHHVGLGFRGVLVELHLRPSTRLATDFPSEAMFDRAHRERVLELEIPVADPVDELVYLALHAAGHNLERDVLLLDLKLLARKSGLDWPKLEQTARQRRVHRALGAALLAAEARVGFPAEQMPASWRTEAMRALEWLPSDWSVDVPKTRAESILNLVQDALWSDSWLSGARYLGVRVGSAGWRSVARKLAARLPR